MALAHTKFFSIILLLFIGGGEMVRAADPATKESDDLLEAARRDLRELPSLERSLTPPGRLPESTLQLPLLTPATPAPKAGEEDPVKPAEPSQGWLLDALKLTETKERSRTKASAPDNRLSPEATRRKSEGAPNPLSNYLQQWLSPQDRRLLGGEKPNQTALERAGIRDAEPFRPKINYDTKPLLSNPRERLVLPDDRVNPYLIPGPTEESSLREPLTPAPSTFASRPSLSPLLNSTVEQRTYSPSSDTNSTTSGSTKPEALPPPTAPLLDERRYFPQLRRF